MKVASKNGVLWALSLALVFFYSCGEDAPALFATAVVGSMSPLQAPFVVFTKDDRRLNDAHLIVVEETATGARQLVDLEVQHHLGGKAQFRKIVTGSLAEWGISDGTVIDAADSYLATPYLLVRDGDTMKFVDTYGEKPHSFGNYNFGIFWIYDNAYSRQPTVGQALLINGAIATDSYGVQTIVSVNAAHLYDLNTKKESTWRKVEGAFSDLPGGEQFFVGARNPFIAWHSGSSDEYGSTIVLIDANGRIKYLESTDSTSSIDFRFSDRTMIRIPAFAALDLPVNHFNYYIEPQADSIHTHLCAIAASQKGAGRSDLYLFQPNADGTTNSARVAVEDVYPEGTCSVIHYTRNSVSNIPVFVPWVTYHSGKNELSVAHLDEHHTDFETFVLDRAKSSNWVFADRVNSITKAGQGGNSEIMIFYNDNESLKIAACVDFKKCGFDSSLFVPY